MIDHAKRKFLKFLGCSTILSLSSFPVANALLTKPISSEEQLKLFTEISTVLTDKKNLSPLLAKEFYVILRTQYASSLNLLLEKIREIKKENISIKNALKHAIESNNQQSLLIKKIIEMWYTGSIDGKTISAAAYRESCLWNTFGTSASGLCLGEMGIWQNKPQGIEHV